MVCGWIDLTCACFVACGPPVGQMPKISLNSCTNRTSKSLWFHQLCCINNKFVSSLIRGFEFTFYILLGPWTVHIIHGVVEILI